MALDKTQMADIVQQYLDRYLVVGVTFRVNREQMWRGERHWRVCVHPLEEPRHPVEWYESLASAETDIAEYEGLNVLLSVGLPVYTDNMEDVEPVL